MFGWIKNFILRKKDKTMIFDILVFEEDELPNGTMGMKQHPENGVRAKSAKELVGTYAMCGQRIKILRQYDDNPSGPITATAQNIQSNTVNTTVQQTKQAPLNKEIVLDQQCKPKYFTIGGIECKQEGTKIYQRQWVQVSQNEMENYRLVVDMSNKIVPITGKHLEVKRWVLVEDNNNDNNNNISN